MEDQVKRAYGSIKVRAIANEPANAPVPGAEITVYQKADYEKGVKSKLFDALTDRDGNAEIHDVPAGIYEVCCSAWGKTLDPRQVTVEAGCPSDACFQTGLELRISTHATAGDYEDWKPCSSAVVGRLLSVRSESNFANAVVDYVLQSPEGTVAQKSPEFVLMLSRSGNAKLRLTARGPKVEGADAPEFSASQSLPVSDAPIQTVGGKVGVTLGRTASGPTLDRVLWAAIRNRTRAISFGAYRDFINRVLCLPGDRGGQIESARLDRELEELGDRVQGVGAYQILKTATEVFLLLECGVRIERSDFDPNSFSDDEESVRFGETVTIIDVQRKLEEYLGTPGQLPYITRVIQAAFPGLPPGKVFCDRVLTSKQPCLLELIWSYWHEEGMLAQTINAISRRFQNVRGSGERDPLAHLEIDPLRPLNNLLWGHIQDEMHRLTIRRRAYEYDHHYGLSLYGKAVPSLRPADSRSKFLEGFHNLLHMASVFFKEDHDTTVIADGYPLLNALKEVHLLLAQGAHNQFGDLPWTARAEMLIQEWLLARPEMREFLQSRAMVPYKEGWMPQVDTMKTMQGWSDVTVTHFRDLGVYGEQILLAVRYGDWIDVNNEDSAKNWARYWRPEVQGYLHSYRAVTGIDLSNPDTVDATMPGVHLQKRLSIQQQRMR